MAACLSVLCALNQESRAIGIPGKPCSISRRSKHSPEAPGHSKTKMTVDPELSQVPQNFALQGAAGKPRELFEIGSANKDMGLGPKVMLEEVVGLTGESVGTQRMCDNYRGYTGMMSC